MKIMFLYYIEKEDHMKKNKISAAVLVLLLGTSTQMFASNETTHSRPVPRSDNLIAGKCFFAYNGDKQCFDARGYPLAPGVDLGQYRPVPRPDNLVNGRCFVAYNGDKQCFDARGYPLAPGVDLGQYRPVPRP